MWWQEVASDTELLVSHLLAIFLTLESLKLGLLHM